MAPSLRVPGVYMDGELLSVLPRKWWTQTKEERTSYEVTILVANRTYTVGFPSSDAVQKALGGAAEVRQRITLHVVPLIEQSKQGPWIKWVGVPPLNGAA